MAKRKSKKIESKKPETNNKTGTIAILLIVGVVAVMVYFTLGLKNPDIEVENNVQLPSYAYISARSEQSYKAAIDPAILSGDVFSKIPCYCGCVGVGHTSLKDCFLDAHGSMCDVCQYEALEAYDMVKKGTPIAEIRATIDLRYGSGNFGPGTNTPPVA
jgi:hypothetical protein